MSMTFLYNNRLKQREGLKAWWLILLLFILSSTTGRVFGQALDTLSLEGFLKLAKQQTIQKEAAVLNFELAQLENQIFKTQLMPQVTLLGNLPNFIKTSSETLQPNGTIAFQSISNNNSFLSLNATQALSSTGGTLFVETNLQRFDDFSSDFTSYNGVPFRLGINQPLFGYNELRWEKKLAPVRLLEAQKQYVSEQETIYFESLPLFFDLLIAQLDVDISTTNATSNQKLFEIATEKFELGNISTSDLKQLELEWIRAKRNKKVAEQSLKQASYAIYAYLGETPDTVSLFPEMPEFFIPIEVDPAIALREARQNRAELDGFIREWLETQQSVALAKGNGGFQASLRASLGFTRSGQSVGDVYQNPQQEQLVQLQLNVPILDWGQQKKRVQLAKTRASFIQKRIEQDKIDFETAIYQVVLQFNNVQEQIAMVTQLRDLALERFEITKESYLLGAISIRELSLSQGEKDQAIREYTNTLSLYWNSYYLLRRLTLYDFVNQQKIK